MPDGKSSEVDTELPPLLRAIRGLHGLHHALEESARLVGELRRHVLGDPGRPLRAPFE